MSLLEHNETITIWDYGNISPGAEREQVVGSYIDEAQIILLLISADFLDSHYLYKVVVQKAIERHERKETRVIPIIMRSASWEGPPLDKLQALPDNAKAIALWRDRDEGFTNVVEGLIKVTKQWEAHSLAEPVAQRKMFMAQLDQLIQLFEAVNLQLQPPERAMHTVNTLKQLSIYTPNETTLADLVAGWQTLSHSAQEEEDIATSRRRITCGELATIASQFTTEQGNLAQAIKTWGIWRDAFKNSDDPRQAAMEKTFTRELKELQAKEKLG